MENLKKLEIIMAVLLFIGVLSWLSQKFFYIEALKGPYGLGDFFLLLGFLLWCIILWKRGKEENETEKTK
jgi:hypothetical protein